MAKLTIFILLCIFLEASSLEKNCLLCHDKEQIPSNLIYKRYLLKYSTKNRIKESIYSYLKNPKKENSIMPKPFFSKFPMKKPLNLDDKTMKKNIEEFIEKFDVKKRLILEWVKRRDYEKDRTAYIV